jgi:hypothetical protein
MPTQTEEMNEANRKVESSVLDLEEVAHKHVGYPCQEIQAGYYFKSSALLLFREVGGRWPIDFLRHPSKHAVVERTSEDRNSIRTTSLRHCHFYLRVPANYRQFAP